MDFEKTYKWLSCINRTSYVIVTCKDADAGADLYVELIDVLGQTYLSSDLPASSSQDVLDQLAIVGKRQGTLL